MPYPRGGLAGAEDYLADRDAPQPSSVGVRSIDEYDADERARIAKADAGAARAKAQARRSRPGLLDRIPAPIRRHSDKALVAELVAAVTMRTIAKVSNGDTPGVSDYVPIFVVYLILGFAGEIGGDDVKHLAAGFGGLVLLAITMQAAPGLVKATGALGIPTTVPTSGASTRAGAPLSGPGVGTPNRPGKPNGNRIGTKPQGRQVQGA